ncbi:hypothetical protein DPMN_055827 [Dreissena polymorpha]|uniref:Uncharacterized protein n=1 Tax=Dreissena polymorpha TaxID=45954 RepID=A0A9D4HSL9_DREPO|nr:hypothetical protein DPMN_055827 [Dreissena polymorpha]
MRDYRVFHLVQQNASKVKTLSCDGQQRYPYVVGAETEVAFLGERDEVFLLPISDERRLV